MLLQTSMVQYQRISPYSIQSLHQAELQQFGSTSFSDYEAVASAGLARVGVHDDNDGRQPFTDALPDTPPQRIPGLPHGTDDYNGEDGNRTHASLRLLRSSSLRRSIREHSIPRPLLSERLHHASAHTALDGEPDAVPPPPPLPPPPEGAAAAAERGEQACYACVDAAAAAVLMECGHGGLCAGEAQRAPRVARCREALPRARTFPCLPLLPPFEHPAAFRPPPPSPLTTRRAAAVAMRAMPSHCRLPIRAMPGDRAPPYGGRAPPGSCLSGRPGRSPRVPAPSGAGRMLQRNR